MYSGSRSRSQPRSSAASGAASAPTTHAARNASPAASWRTATAAADTPGWAARAASTSPGSIRKPRTFTCASSRPMNASSPAAVQRTRSPLRYIRAPGIPAKGSARNAAAVGAGRSR